MTEVERHQLRRRRDRCRRRRSARGHREPGERGLHGRRRVKSLFGKAHTVMAEGGCAAAMGNANAERQLAGPLRATPCAAASSSTTGGWPSCTPRKRPDRVWELETYGALFDRTKDGQISQRNFGGHTYPRLAHVGDRTGLELIRTLQQKIVSLQQEDYAELGDYEAQHQGLRTSATDHRRCDQARHGTSARSPARSATGARPAGSSSSRRPAVVLATGGIGKSFKVTSNSWEYTGDGHALALRAGVDADQHGVHPVPPDRHGLAAVGQGHPGHRGRCAATAAC